MARYTLPLTEARGKFLSLVKDVGATFSRYVITYRGKPEAVIFGYDEFEGWLETLEIAQSPSWKRALAKAKKEDKAGKKLSFESLVGRKQRGRR